MVKKNNYFDKIKKNKFSKMTKKEGKEQLRYFEKWTNEMLFRKEKGNEKYGNYMMDCDDQTSFRELEEEMLDVCNHLIMLTYKIKKKLGKYNKK